MNTEQIMGYVEMKAGIFQQYIGRLLGNPNHQSLGIKKQSLGKQKVALGESREIIKLALRRHILQVQIQL
jgi:hypothetical protein